MRMLDEHLKRAAQLQRIRTSEGVCLAQVIAGRPRVSLLFPGVGYVVVDTGRARLTVVPRGQVMVVSLCRVHTARRADSHGTHYSVPPFNLSNSTRSPSCCPTSVTYRIRSAARLSASTVVA